MNSMYLKVLIASALFFVVILANMFGSLTFAFLTLVGLVVWVASMAYNELVKTIKGVSSMNSDRTFGLFRFFRQMSGTAPSTSFSPAREQAKQRYQYKSTADTISTVRDVLIDKSDHAAGDIDENGVFTIPGSTYYESDTEIGVNGKKVSKSVFYRVIDAVK